MNSEVQRLRCTECNSSHPSSDNYGRHWTSEDVIKTFQPSKKTVDSVLDWLVDLGGISRGRITHSDNKGWLAFDATAWEVEKLLHTEFNELEHTLTGNAVVACDAYHVPKSIQDHIDYVTPGVKGVNIPASSSIQKRREGKPGKPYGGLPPKKRPMPHMPSKNNSDLANCDIAITPACIRALYHFDAPNPNEQVSSNNSMGIFEDGDFYSQEDLNLFFANFTSYIPAGTHPIPNFVDGAEAPVPVTDAGGESDLDFELAYPIM